MGFDIDPKDENYERDLMIDEIKKLQNDLALKGLKGLEAKKLTEQRDALLGALKDIIEFAASSAENEGTTDFEEWNMVINARAAIAAVEGK